MAVLTAANAVGQALASLNLGLFIKPMGDELGISRAEFGWAGSVRSIAGAVTSPWMGRLVDRHGARWLLAGTTLIAGLAVMALAWIDAARTTTARSKRVDDVARFAGKGLPPTPFQ